jgi:hypothetical protein
VENNGNFPILAFGIDCRLESTSLKIGFLFDVINWVRIAYIWQEKMPNSARDRIIELNFSFNWKKFSNLENYFDFY